MSSWLLYTVPLNSSPISKLANIVLSTVAETTSNRNMDKRLAKYFVVVVSYGRKYVCFSQIQFNTKTKPARKQKRRGKKWSLTLLHDVQWLVSHVSLFSFNNDSLFLHLPWILYMCLCINHKNKELGQRFTRLQCFCCYNFSVLDEESLDFTIKW